MFYSSGMVQKINWGWWDGRPVIGGEESPNSAGQGASEEEDPVRHWRGWQVQQKAYILILCQEIGEMVV